MDVEGLRLEAEPSVVGGLRLIVRNQNDSILFCLQPKAKRSSNLKHSAPATIGSQMLFYFEH
jgi:hypothetical protein